MVKSIDYDVNGFLREIDQSLEASRNVFRHFDDVFRVISDLDWQQIEKKVFCIKSTYQVSVKVIVMCARVRVSLFPLTLFVMPLNDLCLQILSKIQEEAD